MEDHLTTHQAQEDARNDDILIYVDGDLKPRNEATVSVFDSGFMPGDGVWDGLRLGTMTVRGRALYTGLVEAQS